MSFKIKDSFQVGTVVVTNSSGIVQDAALQTKVTAGTYSGVTVDVYGRVTAGTTATYLTAEADTLATVTGRGATTSVAISITNATAATTTATGALIVTGGLGVGGAIWAGSVQGTPVGSTTRSTGAFTTLDANDAVGLSPANKAVTLSPTGTGIVTINPATLGTIDKMTIGGTTRAAGNFTTLDANSTVGLSPASANVTISPTGTGTVAISPAGALTVNPTAASTINNTSIGATTRAAGAFTTLASNNAVTMTGGTSSTTTGTGQLVVTGGVGVSENVNVGGTLTVTGNLTVNGTTTTLNSTTVTIDDPIFVLGGDTAPASDDNLDRGIKYQWHNGSVAKAGFFGMDDSSGYFSYWQDVTDTASVMSGTLGDMAATNFRGALVGNADTATKLAATKTIAITGDLAYTSAGFDGSGNVTGTGTLATVCASPGTFSSVVVNGKGLVTSGSNPGYLTAEADTLQTVTGRGGTTTADVQHNGASIILAPTTTARIYKKAIQPAAITVNTLATIDTFATATYRNATYLIQVVQGTKYQQSEVRMVHDNTTVYLTEFAVVESNAGAPIPCTFTAAIATGTLTFSATITDAASTNATVTMERTLFAV